MSMQKAIWKVCPGIVNDGVFGHQQRDACSSCGPFWEKYPSCPQCGGKLMKRGKTKCKKCAIFVQVDQDPGLTKAERNQYANCTRWDIPTKGR
jgi:predicted amidophosphoribosyltransferase